MKRNQFLCAALSIVMLPAFAAFADESADAKKCKCPVAGKELVVGTAAASTQYKDATVYFCCGNCQAKFEADNKKFATKANQQLVATGQAKQVKCPIAGRPVNPAQSVTVDNVKVGFCCGNCKGKAASAEGDAQRELLFGEKAFKTGFEVAKK